MPALPPDVPIGRIDHGGRSVFLSSDMIVKDATVSVAHRVKRRSGGDIDYLSRRFNPAGGPGRDTMTRSKLTSADQVSWFAWADQGVLRSLLPRIKALGALRGHGYGRIRVWAVDVLPNGHPVDAVQDDASMTARRAMPASWVVWPVAVTPLPVTPPYWHRDSVVSAVPPGAVIALKTGVLKAVPWG